MKSTCMEQGLISPVNETRGLRRILEARFENQIGFFQTGRNCVVHNREVNPCEYPVATIKGKGMRDDDIIRAFGALVKRRMNERRSENTSDEKFPYRPDRVSEMIEEGPLPELYNVLCATKYKDFKINQHGYAETKSHIDATKIWALASDWESLITGEKNAKQIITGSVIGRLTGRKDVILILNKMGHSITYEDFRNQTKRWASTASESGFVAPMVTGIPTHVTLDNNDGSQETVTGKGTTHDTNFTIFQPILKGENITPDMLARPSRGENMALECTIEEKQEIPEYSIGQKKSPPLFPSFVDNTDTHELDKSLKEDLVWAITIGLENKQQDDQLDFIGSWTDFKKKTTISDYQKSLLEYLPAVSQPPDYPVCKKFLDDLLELIDDLGIPHIFAHGDEKVYACLTHIIWKDPELYKKIMVIMGGFHQLRVRYRIIHKRHGAKGYQTWCVDSRTIAGGSSASAIEGRHYYRSMRIHKEMFCALAQTKVEKLTDNYQRMDVKLKEMLLKLKSNPSARLLESIVIHPTFQNLFDDIMQDNGGTDNEMSIEYLKDVSSMLAMVAAVRDNNIELHLQAERQMIKYCFAFDHVHYARYLGYQNVYLRDLERKKITPLSTISKSGDFLLI